MNEKTARQIEEAKKQTIGVEVEMNGITRRRAAEVAAGFFGTGGTGTPRDGTDITPGARGTHRAGNGSSRGMSASQGRTARNASW